MKNILLWIMVLVGLSVLNGCAMSDEKADKPEQFSGSGTVVAVDAEKNIVTIDHGEIKGLMSAMTMDFAANEKDLLEGIEKDDLVDFTLQRIGEDLKLVKIKKTGKLQVNGADIYKQTCAKCHGDKGEGAKKGIPLIEGHALNHPEEDFLKQVREGGEKMPAFSDKLSDEEIASVVKFVRDDIQKGLRKDAEGGHKH